MSFFEKLEELRQKPEGVKRRIVFAMVSFLMILITIFWIQTLRFGREDAYQLQSQDPSPWSVLKKTFEAGKEKIGKVLREEVYLKLPKGQ